MYLNKQGSVIISTMIILALMSILGTFSFKMIKNNNELSYLYNFDGDIYNLQENEENLLKAYMNELSNIDYEQNSIFEEDFIKNISKSTLEYKKESNKLFLKANVSESIFREREIEYVMKNNKIILVPTYKFKDIEV